MWFDIFKRELLDHLMSIRFALTVILTVLLLALNGITFAGGDFTQTMNEFIQKREETFDKMKGWSDDLGVLGVLGPDMLYKRPSPLAFCASGRDKYLPREIRAYSGWSAEWGGTKVRGVWQYWYDHIQTSPPSSAVVSDFVEIDWGFIIGFVLSLAALLLTFDGICGERQAGTLKLMLSGAVPRVAVLGGKYAAALMVLALALGLGLGVNLLIIGLFGPISLDAEVWGKIAAMGLASGFYLAFFVGLGLLVSSRFERPAASLVTLLLIWSVIVILLPNTTAGLVSSFQEPLDWDRHYEAEGDLDEKHRIRSLEDPNPGGAKPYAHIKKIADYLEELDKVARQREKLILKDQLEQVELGRDLNRITPFGTFQYALESLSDTGIARHLRLIEAANRYRGIFNSFIAAEDAGDPDSHHLMRVGAGMSRKPVRFEAVPKFKEDLSARATVAATAPICCCWAFLPWGPSWVPI
jgi:hypothetical protein